MSVSFRLDDEIATKGVDLEDTELRSLSPGFKRLLIGCYLLLGFCVLFMVGLIQGARLVVSLQPTATPVYWHTDSAFICSVLEVNPEDPFCVSSVGSDAFEFEDMLERRFPPRLANYDEVMDTLGGYTKWCPALEQARADYPLKLTFDCEFELPQGFEFSMTFLLPSGLVYKYLSHARPGS